MSRHEQLDRQQREQQAVRPASGPAALRHDEDERDDRDEAADCEPEKKENGRPAEAGGVEDWPGTTRVRHKGRVTAASGLIPDR